MTVSAVHSGFLSANRPSKAALALVALLVYASAVLCLALAWNGERIAGIWLGNAFILAPLLTHARRHWPSILAAGFIGNFIADLTIGDPISSAIVTPLINLFEVLIVAYPMRYFRFDRDFTRTQSLIPFYILAAGPAPLIAGLLASAYFETIGTGHFWVSVWTWFGGDALGLIMLVPPLLTVKPTALRTMFSKEERLESVALIGLLLSVAVLNYVQDYPTAFLFFPCVLLLTFKRGFAGGSIGLLIVAIYMVAPILLGSSAGALKPHTLREQVTIVQIFVAVVGFSVALVGAALEERRRLEQWLASAIARAENSREEALVAKDAAEKASRSKSMFLANMSHELRTPLNAVIGFSEMMHAELFGPLGDKRYLEYTGLIRGAGKHLLDLINDILDMSKIEAGKQELHRERLDLADLVRETVKLMQEQATAGSIALECSCRASTAIVSADRRAMKQILLNLLSNAVKFTPEYGQVTAEVRYAENRVVLSVRDTGIGIPAEQIYRLGNPFVQVRNTAGTTQTGTGLGLALVRALTEMHQGKFRIESVEGEGTTVTLTFPRYEEENLAA